MTHPGYSTLLNLAPDDAWRRALEAAPRHLFVPRVAATDQLLDRDRDPDAWWAAVAGDTAIVTQVDDGRSDLSVAGSPSSSTTLPSLVFEFLRLLDPYVGDRVLEIGTGTGWTAALLSARLGAENVTSIEVDQAVAAQARANLNDAGLAPTLVTGDGSAGHPSGAPYDRVHITCAVREIPYAWVEQSRPGGRMVLPWLPNHVRGHTVVLTVADGRAVGRIGDVTTYMMLRGQREDLVRPSGTARTHTPRVDPRRIAAAGPGFLVVLAALAPGLRVARMEPSGEIGLRHGPSASYANRRPSEVGGGFVVTELGSAALWETLEAAYLAWLELDSPPAERFGLVVDRAGEHLWLDQPENRATEIPQGASMRKK
ncbi:methyltransferase domain-containing protein [Spiractinospora alimapuensis]|uniref:methyltransferase domain-containing protein n=1 Tax=Spiractinospora alimapuensis TaxID=2820884 RepID=UPI001F17DCFF|nr:methyltransferase domain-containing protein [Spiractinospora alimapuensis]QVQ50773.1 methyltransferase domain-containing protein [Spiractinospora alimapuensis]